MLLMGLFLILVGGVMLFFPDEWFKLTEHWKSYSPAEPSKWYCISCRIGGGCMLTAGIFGAVMFFVMR